MTLHSNNNCITITQFQASGWPKGVVTAEQKAAYIKAYHAREGILLDEDKIENNPGRRAMAKLCLNSLWVS